MKAKNNYPFRLGTTSFIYPADYVTNVRRLAPRLNEIELLLFECEHLPSRREIGEIKSIGHDQGITFNVHLPMDISMANDAPKARSKSVTDLARTIERVSPLSPSTHTLHLTYDGGPSDNLSIRGWQNRATESTGRLLDSVQIPARDISVETLDFDPQWLEPIVQALDLAVCLDVGHVIRYGYNLSAVLKRYARHITIVHLHGVQQGKDHLAISQLDAQIQELMAHFLIGFNGSLSIEVFCAQKLEKSLAALPGLMARAAVVKT